MAEINCPQEEELLPLVADDADHVQPHVREHVEHCSSCQKRLKELDLQLSTLRAMSVDTIPPQAPPAPLIYLEDEEEELPAAIGRYRVVGMIGKGGQGLVFRVVHPTLQKDLVLKLGLRRLSASGLKRDRLAAEGRLLADLDHPNLARVVDLDVEDDRPFLVLEYVRGRTLRQYLRDEQPSPREIAELLADVARALVPAHAAGVIHQDLKPANILIDEQGRPRIIDFGMAMLRGAWTDETLELESIGGTLSFMSPEQARADIDRIGPACDIFALGAILYDALTGQPPYTAETVEDALELAKRCEFDRQKLIDSAAPGALVKICLRAMSSEPGERQRSAKELADELDRFAGRRRWWPAALGATALLLGMGLAIALWPAPDARTEDFQYLIQAERGDRLLWVHQELPLRAGDRIRVFCDVPAHLHPSLFWFNSDGQWTQLDSVAVKEADAPGMMQLVYPADGRKIGLDAAGGTEFVLVCASVEATPQLASLRESSAEFLATGPLPPLPNDILVVMRHGAVASQSSATGQTPRGFTPPAKSNAAIVEDRLEQLRVKLRSKYPFVTGIAFPHR
ncbi:MAG: serine/threonine-protein kinase [Pirellulaceae bacterium]